MCLLLRDSRLLDYSTPVSLVRFAGFVRTAQLSLRTPFSDVATSMGLWDGASSPIPIDGGRWYDLFLFFQRQTSRKATARAVLQAFALPQRSFTRNIEAAQRQYESKLPVLLLLN